MLSGRIKIQVVAFVVLGLLATTYLGAKYVGINLFGSGYDVTVSLPMAGGTFENGEVTYRGVPVGRIKDLRATDAGAEAVLHIDGAAPPIPADLSVAVHDRSAIGEQYIDLRGGSTDGRLLSAGDHLSASADSMPPPIDELLRTGRDFLESVPQDSLNTVIDESYLASRNGGEQLARLLDTSQEYAKTANRNFLVTAGLIENSSTVLSTQLESADSIRGFSRDLDLMATALRTSDPKLRRLIASTPAATREIGRLFTQVGRPLGTLMGNLITPAEIFGVNAAGVEDTLIRLPEAISIGFATNGSQGMSLGLAQTYFDPLPCTSGYGDTAVRPGLDTGPGKPFNLEAGCTLRPSSGANVRGPGSVAKHTKGAARTLPRVGVATTMDDLFGGAR